MKKITLAVFLVLFTISCASFMAGPYPDDPSLNLLYGVYLSSLIANPPKSYYRSPCFYNHPGVWADWSPLQKNLWIQSQIENSLRDYEDKIWWINFSEKTRLENEIRGLIDDLERAKKKD